MKLLATKKGKIICGVAVAVLMIVVLVITIIAMSDKGYRSITVEDVQGSVIVMNDKSEDQAYKGQRLYGGDDVTVREKSSLTMRMNQDKYLYADENTHFRLENHSVKNASRIRILLDQGSELSELTKKLNPNESYEVDTPNSTMSVRGTKFRVTVFTESDAAVYTLLEVEEGVVLVRLKTVSGVYTGVEKEFLAGQGALIRADADNAEFMTGEDGGVVLHLDYLALPKDHVSRLQELVKSLGGTEEREAPKGDGEEKTEDGEIQGSENKSEEDEQNVTEDPSESSEQHEHVQGEFEITVSPGCETKGEQVAKCTICGEPMETQEVKAVGHSFADWTMAKAASCLEEGSEIRTCKRCGKTETRTVSKTDHQWSDWHGASAATCGSNGSDERNCTVCGEKETRTVSATGNHQWGSLIVDTPAGCTDDGSGHHSCVVCGAYGANETIPKTGHAYEPVSQEDISDTMVKVTYRCKNCGSEYTVNKTKSWNKPLLVMKNHVASR